MREVGFEYAVLGTGSRPVREERCMERRNGGVGGVGELQLYSFERLAYQVAVVSGLGKEVRNSECY